MPRKKLELTKMNMPAGVPERWRKIYKGKAYLFRGDYSDCLNQWYAKRVELAEADKLTDLEIVEVQAARLRNQSDRLAEVKDQSEASAIVAEWRGKRNTIRNINQAVEQFLSYRKVKVDAGTQSIAYFAGLVRYLEDFAVFVGKNQGVDKINGQVWQAYSSDLLKRQSGGLSPKYCNAYHSAAKTFIKWAYRNELLKNLPRNLDDRDLNIKLTPKTIKVFEVAEVKSLLTNSAGQDRLYLLLALNCGFTQKDISDLRQSEIDWKRKRIIRKRSKTKDAEGVPTIEYLLWDATYELLKRHGANDPNRVLLHNGLPLIVESLNGVKIKKTDEIRDSFIRVRRRSNKNKGCTIKQSFKIFRKTSPSLLQKSATFSYVARHFLGHAPRGVADIHYAKPDQSAFDAAIEWLGEQYEVGALTD